MDPRVTLLHRTAAQRADVLGMAGGLPADAFVPHDEIARALTEAGHTERGVQYGWPEGEAALREWIARRLVARGADVAADRVIVTAGAQQALAIAAQLVPERTIDVGDATYPGALDAFAHANLRTSRAAHARYLIDGVANPQGIALDRALGSTSIVDEAYVELRFDGVLRRPLAAEAPDRVWHVGTIAKTIAPGLRIGWLVPPLARHADALQHKHASDLQAASITQAALVHLLRRFDYDAHVAKLRASYAARAALFVEALRRVEGIRFTPPEGGFSVWIETGEAGDELSLLRCALAEGVMFDPGGAFSPERRATVAARLSFSNLDPEDYEEATRRLTRTLRRWRRLS